MGQGGLEEAENEETAWGLLKVGYWPGETGHETGIERCPWIWCVCVGSPETCQPETSCVVGAGRGGR